MPWVLMVTLCSTLSRKAILSHGGILYLFPDILHINVCFRYMKLIEYNIKFKFPAYC